MRPHPLMETYMKRVKTKYPGIYYREADRIGGTGTEKVYYIVFKKNGKIHEEKVGRQFADDMTPARAALIRGERIEGKRLSRKELREQEEARRAAEEGQWTIDKLFNSYIDSRPKNNSRATDSNRYKNHLEPIFGKKKPSEIIPLDVDRLRIKLLKKLSPQTVKHVLNLLTWIVNYGVKRGLCDPLNFHIKKPTVNNIRTEDLNEEQLRRLLEAIEKDENLAAQGIMKMALFTGMRRGELFRLKWVDVDFDRGFIHIRDPKGGQDQKIPMSNSSRDILEAQPRTESEYIFPGKNGGERVAISKAVNRIKNRAGLPKDFRPLHGLRHVYASMLASSGQVDMYTLQKLLTHKSPIMTQRYAHLRDETLKRASDLAGNIITDAIAGSKKEHNGS
jgi:integrase